MLPLEYVRIVLMCAVCETEPILVFLGICSREGHTNIDGEDRVKHRGSGSVFATQLQTFNIVQGGGEEGLVETFQGEDEGCSPLYHCGELVQPVLPHVHICTCWGTV